MCMLLTIREGPRKKRGIVSVCGNIIRIGMASMHMAS